jgi:hypothetical protein
MLSRFEVPCCRRAPGHAATATASAQARTGQGAAGGQGPAGAASSRRPSPSPTRATPSGQEPARQQRAVLACGARIGPSRALSSLPGAEQGVLIQSFVQYPGSRFTTAGEAWRQVRNQWIIPYGGSLLLIVLLALGSSTGARAAGRPRCRHRPVIERFTPFERVRTGPTPSLRGAGHLGHRDGLRQVLPAAGARWHAVRLADLRPEDGAQLRRPAVRGVAGDRASPSSRTTCRAGDLPGSRAAACWRRT